jgi:putative membrane protein
MKTVAILAEYYGINGFLGSRASLMLDVVFLAMFLVLPVLGWSIVMVRYRRLFVIHKRVQLAIAIVLLAAIVAFEIDMQFVSGWRDRAASSRLWPAGVMASLYVHLFFAVTTAAIWIYVVTGALRNIPRVPGPSTYSRRHIVWARLAAIDLALTAVTGWIFYLLAFVC